MITRPLGASGIEASAVALGTWVMGGWMWGGASEDDSIRAVHAAIDEGITLLDTAPIYGFGHSEIVVGKALKNKRDKVLIATKCGMVINAPGGRQTGRSTADAPHEHGHLRIHIYNHPDSVRDEVEMSLKRLGTDHIDLYQTHWQEEDTPIEDTMGCLLELKDEGKIRAIGVCNASAEHMERYRAVGQLDSDQEQYSMIKRDMEDDGRLAFNIEHNQAVLAYSPLALGLLTGKVDPDDEYPASDLRSKDKRFTRENRVKVRDLLAQFEPIKDKHGCTMAQLVIAWTIAQEGVTHALVGARNERQAIDNARAADVALDGEDLSTLNGLVRSDAAALAL